MPSRNMVMLHAFDWICLTVFSKNSSLVNIPRIYSNVEMECNSIANFVCSTTYYMSAMWSGIIWEMYEQNVLNTKFFMNSTKWPFRIFGILLSDSKIRLIIF